MPPSTAPKYNLTVLISGTGTNLSALIAACAPSAPLHSARIGRVVSSSKHAGGLLRAERAQPPIKTSVCSMAGWRAKRAASRAGGEPSLSGLQGEGDVKVQAQGLGGAEDADNGAGKEADGAKREADDRAGYDADLAKLVLADSPDLVVCAGWMRVLSPAFLEPVAAAGVAVVNLHPALPGQFNGTHAIERAHKAWQAGEIDRTGVMVHYVVAEVDMGEPILVEEIPFVAGEDETLERFEQKVHEREWKVIVEGTRMALERVGTK
ncbi:putative phosphoribosylglycinamide formyltransferase [Cryomyces antarcticus]|uniref:phosphoribosylglycinamide formyltransferase 1 n=1 Tax=Cryomyces antarcticus TaxID=329879 RepID=A0ABR0KQR1_9PEZI|nr:Bifunctional purine biosynthetic protein ADE5,7 [Cryomyces antarcticus]KAK5007140.1 Bifunctional purine biosynthetic protein ADE5,7 [Cryomyces antarcticus]KAK5108793.1 Bifunctional purine biosynthetic protein ADE5,7 [Cryomyces antarcticus]KAK5171608.1 hypothetical protein LTR04_000890 [Oleoguttula sp. CCFEE 6159]